MSSSIFYCYFHNSLRMCFCVITYSFYGLDFEDLIPFNKHFFFFFFLSVKCNVKGLYISSLCNHIPIVYSPLLRYVSVKEAACICCQTCTTYLLRELYIPPYICLLLFKCIVFLRIQNSFWETIKRSCQSLSICLHGN